MIEFDDVLREIEVGVDVSEGNYDILRYYRDEYKDLLAEVKRLRPMADELIAIWEILDEDYPQVDRAIVKELIERKIGDYEVIE